MRKFSRVRKQEHAQPQACCFKGLQLALNLAASIRWPCSSKSYGLALFLSSLSIKKASFLFAERVLIFSYFNSNQNGD